MIGIALLTIIKPYVFLSLIPVIIAAVIVRFTQLNNCSKLVRRKMIRIIKNHSEESEKVQEVIDFVLKSGGIEYATEKMYEYRAKALKILHEFPDNPARQSLEELVMYTTERVK